MKKLLLSLLVVPGLAMAGSVNVNSIQCGSLKFNASTTLSQVQGNCQLKKQKMDDGLYQVEFTNDANKKKIECKFVSKESDAVINCCEKTGIL